MYFNYNHQKVGHPLKACMIFFQHLDIFIIFNFARGSKVQDSGIIFFGQISSELNYLDQNR